MSENVLKLLDLRFVSFNYENLGNKKGFETELNIEYDINFVIDKTNNDKVKIDFKVKIVSKDELLSLNLDTIGEFQIDSKNIEPSVKEFVLKRNTIAIMFPFIRSQISLLTTQPGLQPIMLQPIDVNKLEVKQKID